MYRRLPAGKGRVDPKGVVEAQMPARRRRYDFFSHDPCLRGETGRLCGRSPEGRGGGRASAALPLLDDATTSPASRRLASARPALAPKCTPYFLTGPYCLNRSSSRLRGGLGAAFTTKTRRHKESSRLTRPM